MYGWRFCPCRPRERAHPYIHTWTHAVSKNDEFSMYVDFSSCWMGKRVSIHPSIYPSIHTYIQTFISSIRFLHHLKTKIYVCLPMPAIEIIQPTWKSEVFQKLEISFSTARAAIHTENVKKTLKMNCKMKCMYVLCRFDQFLRENKHTYRHPDKQTYNSSSRFLHHLKTRIPCMFANAGRGIIQPTWKIDRFSENPKIEFGRPGPRF